MVPTVAPGHTSGDADLCRWDQELAETTGPSGDQSRVFFRSGSGTVAPELARTTLGTAGSARAAVKAQQAFAWRAPLNVGSWERPSVFLGVEPPCTMQRRCLVGLSPLGSD
jgi:hypothetical protein